jgi:acetolactate synthase regulatory subunit
MLVVTDGATTLSPQTDYYIMDDATAYGENINAGTGSVTVIGQGNYTGTATGTFTIKKATPTSSDLYLYPTNYVYDGQQHSVTVAPGSNVTGMSYDITVKYNGSATPLPREVGMYIITVDIGEGANYTGINDLMIGALTIDAPVVYNINTSIVSGGGSLKLNMPSASENTEIVVTISRSKGFELNAIYAYNANNPAETVNLRFIDDSTRAFTMPAYHVIVAAVFTTNEDEQQLETAGNLVEQHAYVVPQEEANDSISVTNWLLDTIEALTGYAVTVDSLSLTGFVAAVAGTQDTPAGTDGSFVFTVRLTKGDSRLVTSATTGSITATFNTGIEAAGNGLLHAVATDDGLTVLGLVPGEVFGIYTIQGQLLSRRKAGASEERIALSDKGVYIIVAGERKIKAVY